jgi:hypothetical protein
MRLSAGPAKDLPTRQLGQSLKVVGRHLAALAVGDELEAYLLTFAQVAEPSPFDSADMDEGIIAAVIRLDEAEALLGVEPFHGSRSHSKLFRRRSCSILAKQRAVEFAISGKEIVSGAHV